jgi:uroporphyrinogen-III synthase
VVSLTRKPPTLRRLQRQVEAVDSAALARAVTADVVTFASPSTVKAWVQLAGDNAHAPRVACIGYTSAVACATAHLSPCFYPEQPGMDGWVASVLDALKATGQQLSAKGYITFKF